MSDHETPTAGDALPLMVAALREASDVLRRTALVVDRVADMLTTDPGELIDISIANAMIDPRSVRRLQDSVKRYFQKDGGE